MIAEIRVTYTSLYEVTVITINDAEIFGKYLNVICMLVLPLRYYSDFTFLFSTKGSVCVSLMLDHRLRRRSNIKPTQAECLIVTGMSTAHDYCQSWCSLIPHS